MPARPQGGGGAAKSPTVPDSASASGLTRRILTLGGLLNPGYQYPTTLTIGALGAHQDAPIAAENGRRAMDPVPLGPSTFSFKSNPPAGLGHMTK